MPETAIAAATLYEVVLRNVPYPIGSSVGAYPRISEQVRPDGPPTGVAKATSATVEVDYTLTFSVPAGEWWAVGVDSDQRWRYLSFVVHEPDNDIPGPAGPAGTQGSPGPQGVAGPTGPQGLTGPTGPKGPFGVQGVQGPQGPPGPEGVGGDRGLTGPTGPIGPQGVGGPVGPVGPEGPQGAGVNVIGDVPAVGDLPTNAAPGDAYIIGSDVWVFSSTDGWVNMGGLVPGPTGPQGVQGPIGNTGPIGPQGIAGPTGPIGPTGPQGVKGDQGIQGVKGDIGNTGAIGPQGPVGATGTQGPAGTTGAAGPQGVKGDTGATGSQGPQGTQGVIGPSGLTWRLAWAAATTYAVNDAVTYNGASYRRKVAGTTAGTPAADPTNWELLAAQGATGAQGTTGPQGDPGPTGPTGLTGPTGPQGTTGATGTPGTAGGPGPVGQPGPKGDTIWSGAGAPPVGIGDANDFWLDTAATRLYGPKGAGAGSSVLATNPIVNPSFTSDIYRAAISSGLTSSWQNGDGYDAAGCLEGLTANPATTSAAFYVDYDSTLAVAAGRFSTPVVPGDVVLGRCFGKMVDNGGGTSWSVRLYARFADAAGAFLATFVGIGGTYIVNNPTPGLWYELTDSWVAPANAAYVILYPYGSWAAATRAGKLRVDCAQMLVNPTVDPGYFDGRSGADCRWTGAPDRSASQKLSAVWPASGVALIGPAGPTGPKGDTGAQGPAGPASTWWPTSYAELKAGPP